MGKTLALVTATTDKPVIELSEMKRYLRVDHSEDDQQIQAFLMSARTLIEGSLTDLVLLSETWDWSWDAPPDSEIVRLPKRPVTAVTSITSYGQDGAATVFSTANYWVDVASAQIALKEGQVWPTDLRRIGAFVIRFVAGHATEKDIPRPIVLAMKLMVAHWYENRLAVSDTIGEKAQITLGATELLRAYKMPVVW